MKRTFELYTNHKKLKQHGNHTYKLYHQSNATNPSSAKQWALRPNQISWVSRPAYVAWLTPAIFYTHQQPFTRTQ